MRSFCFAILFAVLGFAPVSAEEFRWDGFYAGGSAGWGNGAAGWTDQNTFGWFVPSPFQSLEESGSGFIGGIHVGAMKQWENGIVTGVELSVERPRWCRPLCASAIPEISICII